MEKKEIKKINICKQIDSEKDSNSHEKKEKKEEKNSKKYENFHYIALNVISYDL